MIPALAGIRVVLLDIEGTTTPIAFVHEHLFPYARARVEAYLAEHFDAPDVQEVVRLLTEEHAAEDHESHDSPPPWRRESPDDLRSSVSEYVNWLMDRDRKSPGLKQLQGLIWDAGYRAAELAGEVFDDVPRAIERWRQRGLEVAIYSSGSVLAQRRLFSSTRQGDLTRSIAAFFDTGVGAKRSAASYRRIAEALGCETSAMLFVSDVTAELEAATEAGCPTRLCVRPGNPAQPNAAGFISIHSFDEIS